MQEIFWNKKRIWNFYNYLRYYQRTQDDHPTKTRPWVPGGRPLCCLREPSAVIKEMAYSWYSSVMSYNWSTFYFLYPQTEHIFSTLFVPHLYSNCTTTFVPIFIPQNNIICVHKCHTYFVLQMYPQIFCTPNVTTNIYWQNMYFTV